MKNKPPMPEAAGLVELLAEIGIKLTEAEVASWALDEQRQVWDWIMAIPGRLLVAMSGINPNPAHPPFEASPRPTIDDGCGYTGAWAWRQGDSIKPAAIGEPDRSGPRAAGPDRTQTMTVHMSKIEGRIYFAGRPGGEGVVGDLVRDVGPGDSAFGKSYDEWAALPEDEYEVDSVTAARVADDEHWPAEGP